MPNPVVHFEITGKDGKKLQEFYRTMFGWKIDAANPMEYGLVEAGGTPGIGGGIAQSQPGAPASLTVYIQVDDLAQALKKAEELGGSVVVPPTEIPNMVTFAQFRDPAGNIVGLVKS